MSTDITRIALALSERTWVVVSSPSQEGARLTIWVVLKPPIWEGCSSRTCSTVSARMRRKICPGEKAHRCRLSSRWTS